MKILITIVLYKCKLKDSVSFNCLREQVGRFSSGYSFFIYDNSPSIDNTATAILNSYNEAYYYHVANTSGVSKAYNEAATYAQVYGFQCLLLLDQDTILPTNMLDVYMAAIREHNDIPLFAPKVKIGERKYISPCAFYLKSGHIKRKVCIGKIKKNSLSVINSGLLISVKAFLNCGGYNEKVYLDYSDHEFFSRYKKKYKYFYVLDIELLQNLSTVTKDSNKLISRYAILCECVQNVESQSIVDRVLFSLMLFCRALSLFLLTRKKDVFTIWMRYKIASFRMLM